MTTKGRSNADLWRALDAVDGDLLDADYPASLVDEEIRDVGRDPEEVAHRGAVLVAEIENQHRLAWQVAARQKLTEMRSRVGGVVTSVSSVREELLARLEALRAHPRVRGQLSLAFRKRKPEESTDADLQTLVEDMEALLALHDPSGDERK